MTAADLTEEVPTPAGTGTVADMLRVMDTWSQFLPFVVGKKAAAPDGASVRVQVGEHPIDIVVDGRARIVDQLGFLP